MSNREVRESLKRCVPWLGRLIVNCSYQTEDGGFVGLPAIDGVGRTLKRADQAIDDGDTTELLAALNECVPWMQVVVEGGHNMGCAAPNDAVTALAQARDMVNG